MANKFQKGVFAPVNPDKYHGTLPITFRSSWERRYMVWLDTTSNVIQWNSETLVIPYMSPVDNKMHRYFVDFVATFKTKSGEEKTYAIEIKPLNQMLPPKTRNKERLITEAKTYSVNQAKWDAATKFCKSTGIEFIVLNEKDLGIK